MATDDFAGKVAVVTAGASGIGAAAVRELAKRGARVVVADIDAAAGETLVRAIGKAARFALCDVADIDQATAVIEIAVAHFGRPIACSTMPAGQP
jgi:NAD(P)-dependent dehydrogenase (short-subunit alcohol dehydrogenase family)